MSELRLHVLHFSLLFLLIRFPVFRFSSSRAQWKWSMNKQLNCIRIDDEGSTISNQKGIKHEIGMSKNVAKSSYFLSWYCNPLKRRTRDLGEYKTEKENEIMKYIFEILFSACLLFSPQIWWRKKRQWLFFRNSRCSNESEFRNEKLISPWNWPIKQ